jgi:uncharacterized protein YutE (UPF0331/DUF86 family)
MIRPEVIRKRIDKLDEYLSILTSLRKYSYSEFSSNPEHYGSAERFLHLAIESITDMGNHVIAEYEMGIVNSYSDIPNIFENKGYIDSDLQEKWIKMIGLRNVLIHDYLEVDREIVFKVLQSHLEDIKELKKFFAQFL